MGFEWTMVREARDDADAIEKALRDNLEPFAVTDSEVWFKKQVNVERSEKATDDAP